jgi:hypothetical protein
MRTKYIIILLIAFLLACKKDSPPPDNITPVQPDSLFTNVPDTRDIIMYEVNERAYSPAGDFNGITQRLDEIKALFGECDLADAHPSYRNDKFCEFTVLRKELPGSKS